MIYLKGENPRVEGCMFCEKFKGEDAVEHILYRGSGALVVLNRFPYNNGHMMVVPRQHTEHLDALDDVILLEMMQLVRHAIHALREVYTPHGFNIGVNQGRAAGAGVAEHLHLHVVPRWTDDANYMTVIGQTRVIPESLDDTYATFRPYFDALKA